MHRRATLFMSFAVFLLSALSVFLVQCSEPPTEGLLVELTGRAVAADLSGVPDVSVYLVLPDTPNQRVTTDSDGYFALSAVPAGAADLVLNDGRGQGNLRRLFLDRAALDVGDVLVEALSRHPRLVTIRNVGFEERLTNGGGNLGPQSAPETVLVASRVASDGSSLVVAVSSAGETEIVGLSEPPFFWRSLMAGRVAVFQTGDDIVLVDTFTAVEIYRSNGLSVREWNDEILILDQGSLKLAAFALSATGEWEQRGSSEIPGALHWLEPWRAKAPLLARTQPGSLYSVDGQTHQVEELLPLTAYNYWTTPDGTQLLMLEDFELRSIDLESLAQTTLAEDIAANTSFIGAPSGAEVTVYWDDEDGLTGFRRLGLDGSTHPIVEVGAVGEWKVSYLANDTLRVEHFVTGAGGEQRWRVTDVVPSGVATHRDMPATFTLDFTNTDQFGNPRVAKPPRLFVLDDGETEVVEAADTTTGLRQCWVGPLGSDLGQMRQLTFLSADHFYVGAWPGGDRLVYAMQDPIDGGWELFEVDQNEQ